MTSRSAKPILALLLGLALGLGFAARTIAAPAAGLNWEVHGTGSGGVNLLTGGGSSGPAMSQYIGNGMYSVTLNPPGLFSNNGAGGGPDGLTRSGLRAPAQGGNSFFSPAGLRVHETRPSPP